MYVYSSIKFKGSKFIGIDDKDVISFKGIKYAHANRFEPPKIINKYTSVVKCDRYQNAAYQYSPNKRMVDNISKQSEDCLYLNI
jgi:carboxylesterase type B